MSTRTQNAGTAKLQLREAFGLLRAKEPSDEQVRRALKCCEQASRDLDKDLSRRDAAHAKRRRQMAKSRSMTDVLGRKRSPSAMPGYHTGRIPPNKGKRYRPTPPSVEEVMRMAACCRTDPYGIRMRALLFMLWDGLRINEALCLEEHDLDMEKSSVLIRFAKGGKERRVGIPGWFWPELTPWIEYRQTLPIGPLFCIVRGPTAGRAWASSSARSTLPKLAAKAGVRKRVAPHQLRHACAVRMRAEGFDVLEISRHLGHANIAITSLYLEGVSQEDIIASVGRQPVPQVSALNLLYASRTDRREPVHA